MSCKNVNLTLRQDTLFDGLLTIRDETKLPIDLTGYQFLSSAKEQYTSAVAFSFSFTILDQNTNKGQVRWFMLAAETANLAITEDTIYLYNVLMVQPNTEPINIISGQILIQPKLTPS